MLQWISAALLFLLSLLLEISAQAATPDAGSKNVSRLKVEGQHCHLLEREPGSWVVKSLSDGRTFEITPQRLRGVIEPRLAKAFREHRLIIEPSQYDLHLQCSKGGTALVFSFNNSSPRACVVASVDLVDINVHSNNDAAVGAPCSGERPQALIAGLRDPNLSGETQSLIRQTYPDLIEDLQDDAGFQLLFKLRENFRFKEQEAKTRLEADPNLMGLLDFVDYDRSNSLPAETIVLAGASSIQ